MDGESDHGHVIDGRWAGDGKHGTARNEKRDAHVADISARLRHVCHHLTDGEFSQLVLAMAETKLRFAAIDADAPRRRPVSGAVDAADGASGGPSAGAR